MKKTLIHKYLVVLAVSISLFSCIDEEAEPAEPTTVEGNIYNASTEEPMANIMMSIARGTDWVNVPTTLISFDTTDTMGNFYFEFNASPSYAYFAEFSLDFNLNSEWDYLKSNQLNGSPYNYYKEINVGEYNNITLNPASKAYINLSLIGDQIADSMELSFEHKYLPHLSTESVWYYQNDTAIYGYDSIPSGQWLVKHKHWTGGIGIQNSQVIWVDMLDVMDDTIHF